MQPQCLIRWQQKCRQFNSDSTRTPKLGWGFVQVALRIGYVIPRVAAVAPIKCAAWGCGTSGSCAVKMLAPWHRNLISHQNTRPNSIYFDFQSSQDSTELWKMFPLAAQLFIYLISHWNNPTLVTTAIMKIKFCSFHAYEIYLLIEVKNA